MGPLQRNLTAKEGAALLELAFSYGVNFLDTAEIYGTYPHVREALKIKPDTVVCTKSYSYDTATAEASFCKAVKGIGRDYIDIFLLHEQESEHTIRGHHEAIEYFLRRKEEGLIGAVGLSTHFVRCMEGALRYPELEVLFPLINKTGIGIADGTADQMLNVINRAHDAGRAVFAMKPLGGGHLIRQRQEAFNYILAQESIDAVALGMQTKAEIIYNCALFSGEEPPHDAAEQIACQPRKLMIHDWCEGCGTCVKTCRNGALSIQGGKSVVNKGKCVFCGYCARVCPQFCIKVV